MVLHRVTFLATLFILLLISGAIIMRSYFLRRRYQRRLEEALASGLVLAPHAQGGKRKRFGAKPGLFEVYVRESAHPTYKSGSDNEKYGPPSVGEKGTFTEKDPLGVVGGGGRVVDSLPWGSWGTIIVSLFSFFALLLAFRGPYLVLDRCVDHFRCVSVEALPGCFRLYSSSSSKLSAHQ
jgi:hypothetical protein